MNIDNTKLTIPTKAQDENTNLLHCAFADSVTAKRIRSHTDIKYNIRRAHQTKFHVKPSVVFLKQFFGILPLRCNNKVTLARKYGKFFSYFQD